MSTTLVKPAEVERKWYLLDAAGKSLGHVAAEAAVLLRGKQKVNYTPNVDCGDYVVVVNCDKAVLTGKKAEQKFHITHSSMGRIRVRSRRASGVTGEKQPMRPSRQRFM